MDKVVESVAPLKDFFDALHQGNYSKVEEIQQQISLAEEEADIIKNEVRNHLPRQSGPSCQFSSSSFFEEYFYNLSRGRIK